MMKTLFVIFCATGLWACSLPQNKPIGITPGSGRIVGGTEAKDGQFPYDVAVYLDTPAGSFFCGGALISPQWVLTAGHCVYKATVFTLHLGAKSLVDDDDNRITVATTHSVVHPEYDPNTLSNDIGLIRLNEDVELSALVRPILLGNTTVAAGESVTVSGWGATGDWDGATNELNFVELKTISKLECQSVYTGVNITDAILCTVGETTEGVCNGDSGSPLVSGSGPAAVHVGLVSWTSSAGCETNHPSGFTRTSSYVAWINSVINDSK